MNSRILFTLLTGSSAIVNESYYTLIVPLAILHAVSVRIRLFPPSCSRLTHASVTMESSLIL